MLSNCKPVHTHLAEVECPRDEWCTSANVCEQELCTRRQESPVAPTPHMSYRIPVHFHPCPVLIHTCCPFCRPILSPATAHLSASGSFASSSRAPDAWPEERAGEEKKFQLPAGSAVSHFLCLADLLVATALPCHFNAIRKAPLCLACLDAPPLSLNDSHFKQRHWKVACTRTFLKCQRPRALAFLRVGESNRWKLWVWLLLPGYERRGG